MYPTSNICILTLGPHNSWLYLEKNSHKSRELLWFLSDPSPSCWAKLSLREEQCKVSVDDEWEVPSMVIAVHTTWRSLADCLPSPHGHPPVPQPARSSPPQTSNKEVWRDFAKCPLTEGEREGAWQENICFVAVTKVYINWTRTSLSLHQANHHQWPKYFQRNSYNLMSSLLFTHHRTDEENHWAEYRVHTKQTFQISCKACTFYTPVQNYVAFQSGLVRTHLTLTTHSWLLTNWLVPTDYCLLFKVYRLQSTDKCLKSKVYWLHTTDFWPPTTVCQLLTTFQRLQMTPNHNQRLLTTN